VKGWVVATSVLLLASCTSAPSPSTSGPEPTPSAGSSARSAPPVSPSRPAPPAVLRVSRLPGRLPEPLAREALSRTADPARVVVAGGLLAGDRSSRSTYVLDLRTGRTRPLPDLPTAVHDTAGATLAGRQVVIGGGNASEQSVVQTRRATGWRVLGNLPDARSDLGAVTGRGQVYVVGGYDGRSPALAGVLRSVDGRRWSTVARLPVPVRYAAAALVGGTLWVFGGAVAGAMRDEVQRVDLAAGRARVVAHLPYAVGHEVAVELGGRLLVAGGRTGQDRVTARMWWFRPGSGRFVAAGRLPTPLADSAVVGGGTTAYLVGGETPALSDRVLRLHRG
jgi:hypothetical protein